MGFNNGGDRRHASWRYTIDAKGKIIFKNFSFWAQDLPISNPPFPPSKSNYTNQSLNNIDSGYLRSLLTKQETITTAHQKRKILPNQGRNCGDNRIPSTTCPRPPSKVFLSPMMPPRTMTPYDNARRMIRISHFTTPTFPQFIKWKQLWLPIEIVAKTYDSIEVCRRLPCNDITSEQMSANQRQRTPSSSPVDALSWRFCINLTKGGERGLFVFAFSQVP